jgi:uncharacterized NAD-dependent epimerase/dehydratase family protein
MAIPQYRSNELPKRRLSAVVYCEANFGKLDGKTANGLVRHSELYEISSVIDSEKAGLDAGAVLSDQPNAIPICRDLAEAIEYAGAVPDTFIYGVAPDSGLLASHERPVILKAINLGMNIVAGLHEFLSEDAEFAALSAERNVSILDVRKPPPRRELSTFTGRVHAVSCPRIAVLGTDCAIGKRTTAIILNQALKNYGLNSVLIGTGQTSLIQGVRYGVALDAIPAQFCAGALEAAIVDAYQCEEPDVIVIEGQGSLSHPAFSTSSFILRGGCPNGVVLQHSPRRRTRCDFEQMQVPTVESEVNLIETFAQTKVIGLGINHEHMTPSEVLVEIEKYQARLGIPATDPLTMSPSHLVNMVISAFPALRIKSSVRPS